MTDAEKMKELQASGWFLTRPPHIQAAILRCPPIHLYRIKNSGPGYGPLYSYDGHEGGRVTVTLNLIYEVLLPRRVFGIPLDDLEPLSADERSRHES
jgi:hypothetical protein